jgi:GH43 family beta-xylosidase
MRHFGTGLLLAAAVGLGACAGAPDVPATGHRTFVNPIYEGADPFLVRHTDGYYYFVQTEGDVGLAVWKSDRLTDKGVKRVVWMAPDTGWNTAEVWAPEIHFLDGRWYIYYAASDGRNENHRMGVLESLTEDAQGDYIDRGVLYTGDDIEGGTDNRWAIDGTPLEMNGRLYFVWSGWEDEVDEQWNYIAEMTNPYTIATNRVRLANNDDYLWERVSESADERGLHEAAQVLRRDGWVHLVYSASGSWQPSYKLGLMTIREGEDPMVPANWRKHPEPVFQGNERVHGTGHAYFTTSPDGNEDWIVYHSKISTRPGWQRNVRIQPFTWNGDGTPNFGEAIPEGTPLPLPSGEEPTRLGGDFAADFGSGHWDDWVYYGYNRFIGVQDRALFLNAFPGPGMANHYSSGEKALVRGHHWGDFELSANVRVVRGDQAGLLFRAHHPAVGVNAVEGYFAGLIPESDAVVLGRMDGNGWTEIARADRPLEYDRAYPLRVRANGSRIEVWVGDEPVLDVEDAEHRWGMAGVRGVDAHVLFDGFRITPSAGRGGGGGGS